jgi:hypothetical protein
MPKLCSGEGVFGEMVEKMYVNVLPLDVQSELVGIRITVGQVRWSSIL